MTGRCRGGAGSRTGPVIEAAAIRNQASGASLESGGRGPDHAHAGPGRVSGKVQFLLYGPKGEANGAILEDGTVLRLAPGEAGRLAPGRAVVAEGPVLVTPMGTVVEVKKLDLGPGAS